MKYKIVEEIKGKDIILEETDNLFEAEQMLTYYLGHEHDAYLLQDKE